MSLITSKVNDFQRTCLSLLADNGRYLDKARLFSIASRLWKEGRQTSARNYRLIIIDITYHAPLSLHLHGKEVDVIF